MRYTSATQQCLIRAQLPGQKNKKKHALKPVSVNGPRTLFTFLPYIPYLLYLPSLPYTSLQYPQLGIIEHDLFFSI